MTPFQPPLFGDEGDDRDEASLTPRERFERFHRRHPDVYAELVRVCRDHRSRGNGHWSVDAAYHVVRFQRRMAGLPDEDESFRLNNNYTSFYSRLLMEREPELSGLFEIRRAVRPEELVRS